MSNSEISFYVDTLLVEAVLSDPKLYKKGGFVSDLFSKIKDYFASKIDPRNPVRSVLDELAPGAVWVLFNSLGIGGWGRFIGLLMEVFHVDVAGMLSSLYSKVKSMVSGGEKVSSAQIDEAVDSTAKEHAASGASIEDAKEGYQALQKIQPQQADDGKVYSSLELLGDVRIIRLAMVEYDRQNLRLTKNALSLEDFLGGYNNRRAKGGSFLAKIFGWIIKAAFASAGLMVAGDAVNKIFGRTNSFDNTYRPGQEEPSSPAIEGPTSTQTKYKAKSDGSIPMEMPVTSTPDGIADMVIQFAKDVYSGLDGKENLIRNTDSFKRVVNRIVWNNAYNRGSQTTIMPAQYTSKKQLVDNFIDDVAKSDTA
jgi:hypothetical protein